MTRRECIAKLRFEANDRELRIRCAPGEDCAPCNMARDHVNLLREAAAILEDTERPH